MEAGKFFCAVIQFDTNFTKVCSSIYLKDNTANVGNWDRIAVILKGIKIYGFSQKPTFWRLYNNTAYNQTSKVVKVIFRSCKDPSGYHITKSHITILLFHRGRCVSFPRKFRVRSNKHIPHEGAVWVCLLVATCKILEWGGGGRGRSACKAVMLKTTKQQFSHQYTALRIQQSSW
jgi:hypothetical protein